MSEAASADAAVMNLNLLCPVDRASWLCSSCVPVEITGGGAGEGVCHQVVTVNIAAQRTLLDGDVRRAAPHVSTRINHGFLNGFTTWILQRWAKGCIVTYTVRV